MVSQQPHSSLWRRIGLFLFVLFPGIPVALVFTHGTILIPLLIVMVLGPFIIVNYLLWGWWLSPQTKAEDDRNTAVVDREGKSSVSNSEGIVSEEQRQGYFRR
jgi:hypothetical protein